MKEQQKLEIYCLFNRETFGKVVFENCRYLKIFQVNNNNTRDFLLTAQTLSDMIAADDDIPIVLLFFFLLLLSHIYARRLVYRCFIDFTTLFRNFTFSFYSLVRVSRNFYQKVFSVV